MSAVEVVDLVSDDDEWPSAPEKALVPETSSCMFIEPATQVDTATSHRKRKAAEAALDSEDTADNGSEDGTSGDELVVVGETLGVVSVLQIWTARADWACHMDSLVASR